EKVQRVLDFIDHESRRLVKELKGKQKEAGTLNADRTGTEAHERVKTIEQIAHAELGTAPPRPSNQPLREGGYARHRGLGVEGRVVSLKGGRAQLETAQGRRMEVGTGELEPIVRAEMEATARGGRVRVRVESADIESEINLIGRASDDVDMEIHRFVESALSAGQKFIRIVHGHGTGRLKAAVRQALKGHPGIQKVEDAPQGQGGAGATLITLR
ncbi:MAG TPA: Smr/MutS family protein, partial [Holophaga sp.]|nr:Smr/MutS family protein [Holophaga sp.]